MMVVQSHLLQLAEEIKHKRHKRGFVGLHRHTVPIIMTDPMSLEMGTPGGG